MLSRILPDVTVKWLREFAEQKLGGSKLAVAKKKRITARFMPMILLWAKRLFQLNSCGAN